MEPSACYGSIDFFVMNGDILIKGISKEIDSRKWLGFLGPSYYTRYTEEMETFPFQQEPNAAPRSGLQRKVIPEPGGFVSVCSISTTLERKVCSFSTQIQIATGW